MVPRWIAPAATALGLVVAVVGTFLPWFRSGEVTRSSYEIAGLGLRFGVADSTVLRTVLSCWSAVPVVCAVCVVLLALRVDRTAAVLVGCVACGIGTAAIFFLVQDFAADTNLAVVGSGPVTSIAGAVFALSAACNVFVLARRGTHSVTEPVRSTP